MVIEYEVWSGGELIETCYSEKRAIEIAKTCSKETDIVWVNKLIIERLEWK